MKLADYLTRHGLSQQEFARQVGVTQGMVYQWVRDKNPVSPAKCVLIERVTCGQVSRKDLRADWMEIWPELASPHTAEAA